MGEETTIDEVRALQGCVLDARYRLGDSLGSGGMGLVFDATEVSTNQRVAVKLLRRRRRTPGDVARLLREARLAQRVRHPNIVPVFDVGDDAALGAPFLVSEFVEGGTLRALLQRRSRLAPDEAVAVVAPLCEALAALHDAGVVHRDIKPENVLMARAGDGLVPRLTDFGIARELDADADEAAITQDGAALGTPRYMSPEQAHGQRDLDEQTDVWALGVVLYELIAGRTPFERDNTHATLAAVLMGPIERLDAVAPGVPTELADVVARALERNRVRRFGSAREMKDALLGASVTTPAQAVAADPPPAAPRAPRRPAPVASIALGVTLVAALGIASWARRPAPLPRRPVAVAAPPVVATLAPPAPPLVAPADDATPPPPSVAIAPAPVASPRRLAGPRPPRPATPASPDAAPATRVGPNGAPIEGL